MTFILPSFGASAISAVPGGGGSFANTYSIDLDGTDDYFSTGFAPSGIGTGDYSISWWFNVESGATVDHPYFFTFGATSGAGTATYQGCGLTGRSGDGYKLRVNNNFSGSYTQTASSSTSDVTAGNWYHLLFVRDGNTITLYKNGSSLITLSNANVGLNDLSLGSDLRVGLLHNSNSLFFTGLIDEFAIFNSALSSSDATAIYNSGVPADLASYSPVGWWRMGDNDSGTGTTITDQGSGSNNGTLVNGPTFSTNVPFNYHSLDFDGTDDYVSTELSAAGESELTVSAWVKLDSVSATRGFVTQYASSSDRTFRLAFFPSLNSFWFEVYGPNSYAGYLDASIATGTWYHLAGVYNGSNTVCYVNGVASTTTSGLHQSGTGSLNSSTDNIDIGRMANADYMDGKIDEVAVWTSALSASDITAIYNSGVPADISSYSPVAWWRMGDNDGATGTTITDQGSGGNNGTLNNGPTFSTDTP